MGWSNSYNWCSLQLCPKWACKRKQILSHVHTLLLELFNQKVRYMGSEKIILTLKALIDIYGLAIHNVELSRERKKISFNRFACIFLLETKYYLEVTWVKYEMQNMNLPTVSCMWWDDYFILWKSWQALKDQCWRCQDHIHSGGIDKMFILWKSFWMHIYV